MDENKLVYVAMSGGVDSTVAAVRLLSDGYSVMGIHMQTWKDPQWQNQTAEQTEPVELAKAAAESLGIPFIALDIRDRFQSKVVEPFIKAYLAGRTPNPCLFCNPQVKWGILQEYALEHGANFFATGHYARIKRKANGEIFLLRGVDHKKDQSYVLALLNRFQLQRSLLPLGDLRKTEVREQAAKIGLSVAERQDSQDLCFLGNIDYRDFLNRFAPEASKPGEIVDLDGKVIGMHQGLAAYTIGQRKGIRVAADKPYYVIDKDVKSNCLVVGFAEDVGREGLIAHLANWIAGKPPDVGDIYEVMIRYRAKPVPAELTNLSNDEFRLKFSKRVGGITPGQVAVLYRGDVCLGGGVIQASI